MATYPITPFTAILSGTVTAAVSATSTAYALASYPSNSPKDYRACLITNQGANAIHVEFHTQATGVTATSGVAMPVPASTSRIVGLDGDITHVIAIATSGPTLSSFTVGFGSP